MLRIASVLAICLLICPVSLAQAQTACPVFPFGVKTAEGELLCISPSLAAAWDALVEPRPVEVGVQLGITAQYAIKHYSTPLILESLPAGVVASYRASDNTIRVSPLLLSEDPRVIAASIMHESVHLIQVRGEGLNGPSACVYMEAEAFSLEAAFWGSYWGTSPRPVRTEQERQLEVLVNTLITRGDPGFYEYVVQNPGYQSNCGLWVPTTAAQPQPGTVTASVPTPPPAPPPGPTPMQAARCQQDAMDIATALAPYTKKGSGVAFGAYNELLTWCRQAVTDYGDVGLYCFESANRQAMQFAQSGVTVDPKAIYRSCAAR